MINSFFKQEESEPKLELVEFCFSEEYFFHSYHQMCLVVTLDNIIILCTCPG